MREVKINKEIKDIKERIVFGLSLRQLVFSAIAIVVAVGVFFLLRDYLEIEYLSWVIIIAAGPFAIMGFVTFQGMPAEKIVIELIQSYIVNKKTIENKPKNTYKLMINVMDEESEEGQKKRKEKKIKQSIILVFLFLFITGLVVILMNFQAKQQLQNYISDSIVNVKTAYTKSLYNDEDWAKVTPILDDMESEMNEQTDINSAKSCYDEYISEIKKIQTYPQFKAETFESYYSKNSIIINHPDVQKIYEEEYENIVRTRNKAEADFIYEKAVERLNEEIRSYSYHL